MAWNQLKVKITADPSELEKGLNKAQKAVKKFGKDLTSLGTGLTKLTAPLAAFGAYAAKASINIDEAGKKIGTMTGASGKQLASMRDTMKQIASESPESFDQIATVIGTVNTRLGITGDALKSVSQGIIDISRLNGEDFTSLSDSITASFNNWNINGQQATSTLDKLFVASQATGIKVSQLASDLSAYGEYFRIFGLDITSSIALLSQFNKVGIDSGTVMAALKKASVNFSNAGISVKDGLAAAISKIKSAKTETEALTIATKLFGARGGVQMAQVIREGKMDIDALTKSLNGSNGKLSEAAENAKTFGEKINVMKNRLNIFLQPLGDAIIKIAEKFIPSLKDANTQLGEGTAKFIIISTAISGAILMAGKFVGAISEIIGGLKGLSLFLAANPYVLLALGGAAAGYSIYTGAKGLIATHKATENGIGEIDKYYGGRDKWKNQFASDASKKNGYIAVGMGDENVKGTALYNARMDYIKRTGKDPFSTTATAPKVNNPNPNPNSKPNIYGNPNVNVDKLLKGGKSGGSGKSKAKSAEDIAKELEEKENKYVDTIIQNVEDRIKYNGSTGTEFITKLKAEQSKYPRLSRNWKEYQDEIDNITRDNKEAQENALQKAQDELNKSLQDVDFEHTIGKINDEEYKSKLEKALGTVQLKDAAGHYNDVAMDITQKINGINETISGKNLQAVIDQYNNGSATMEDVNNQINTNISLLGLAGDAAEQYRKKAVDGIKEQKKHQIDLNELTVQWVKDFQEGIANSIVEGDGFSDVLSNISKEIEKMLLKLALFGSDGTGGLFGGIFKGIFSLFGIASANGNVFGAGTGLSAYSNSIVSKPTLFPFAKGVGLMGEAGSEAIMPLTRTSNGKLGVAAVDTNANTNNGVNLNITVNNNGSGEMSDKQSKELGTSIRQMIDARFYELYGTMSRTGKYSYAR